MTRPPIRRGAQPPDDQPRAVALQYQRHRDSAPRIVAKGEGELALKILELAREHGIAIKEDPDLAQLLSAVELETHIPVEAFVAVAEILAFIYRAKSEGPAARPSGAPR
ncbi:MAG TPA: EscU/YscU/HrcU family type III secretion system export apparatus switch protein [Alphaproteobacteria bacterium]|nr:EscU/YscU/HrcU family type III secretion system export apparatus switch protein [Alphaproteobacteria bacterium]